MSAQGLFRISAILAIIGGGLRIIAAFIPWTPDSAPLEGLALVIDLALLFGLMGIYLRNHERLGLAGLAGYAVASAGLALIVGPDTAEFGIDIYYAGVLIITTGLVLLSVQFLRLRIGPLWAPACWLVVIPTGLAGMALGHPAEGTVVAGLLFGLGFVGAGLGVLRSGGRGADGSAI